MVLEENDRRIDYIEISVTDVTAAKRFYGHAFDWSFDDWGPDYASFHDGRLGGGVARVDRVAAGGPLIVLYAVDLEATEGRILEAGGAISRPTFEFPGGRRFHFTDPAGNELAVWSDR
ncbi:MAG TPA: VOC family protein [Gemmatimonadales bacterium]|nr:VOC family protein [Gemmatimonadales bacterium]